MHNRLPVQLDVWQPAIYFQEGDHGMGLAPAVWTFLIESANKLYGAARRQYRADARARRPADPGLQRRGPTCLAPH